MKQVLKGIPLFAEMPDADLERLCKDAAEVRLAAGGPLFAEGDPGDKAYVVTEGQLEVVKSSVGREVLLNVVKQGDVVGEMALLEHKPRMASVRARTNSVLVVIRKEQMDSLLETSLPATRSMFYTVLDRWRSTDDLLRQGEKMAQLGTLAAGVAHELNNPAAAVARATDQMEEAVAEFREACVRVSNLPMAGHQQQALDGLAEQARRQSSRPPEMDALRRSDTEAELEQWLNEHGLDDGWEMAPGLVNLGYDAASQNRGLRRSRNVSPSERGGCTAAPSLFRQSLMCARRPVAILCRPRKRRL